MIRCEDHGQVLVVTLDRHERRNALNTAICQALGKAIADADPVLYRSIVITGAGSAFCAGADLDEVYGEEFRDALYTMLDTISHHPLPVVAAVNGPAVGAGTQLAIACDLRVAAHGATFSVPTSRNGMAVDVSTVRRLTVLAGGGVARRMLLTAGWLTAEQAAAAGLVDEIGDLHRAISLAGELAELAPLAVRYAKIAINSVEDPTVDTAAVETAFQRCWASRDMQEARLARTEKRQPRFTGE